MNYQPVPIPSHLPEKLTLTLWDFSWYVRTGPSEPFADLDRAFAEAVARGYNTVRICAMPFLIFGSGLDTSAITLDRLGGTYAQRVRWYDVKSPTTIDAQSHLLNLFRAAERHDCYVILSSWEYQQSPAFATDRSWFDALMAVEPEHRGDRLADALADLIDFLADHGLDDRIAFTEIHNEVQAGHLTDDLTISSDDPGGMVVALRPRMTRALARFHDRHPDRPCTVNYAGVPAGGLRGLPENADVLVFHPYVYGVLGEFIETFGLRRPITEFPQQAAAASFLLPDAPRIGDWTLPEQDRWKLSATFVGGGTAYAHDWGDAESIDRWLYDHYGAHREEMATKLGLWLDVAADGALARGVPLVFGEGWIGYTPLEGNFEEGPVGAEFCRQAMRESRRVGAWGAIVCSNAAPQHPMWQDVGLQVECNRLFTASSPGC